MSAEVENQYLSADELIEVHRLLSCLNGLKRIAPDCFSIVDSNGDLLGKIAVGETGGWAFHYPAPEV